MVVGCKQDKRRQWHPITVLLPGKSHGQRSLVGYSQWSREELDTTERLHFHFSLSCIGEGNGNPLQCSCLENPRDGGAWWAAINGVTQSRTRLKWLSSSRTNKRKATRWSLRLLLSWQTLNEFWRIRSPYTFQPHVSYKSEEVPSILISFSIFVKERMNIYLLPYPTQ